MVKRWIRTDNGKLSQILEFDSGERVEIPINKDGSVKWLEDKVKKTNGGERLWKSTLIV